MSSHRSRVRLRKAFLTALILVLAAVGGWLFTIRTAFPGVSFYGIDLFWILALGGILLVLGGIALQVGRGWKADQEAATSDDEIADLRVAMKDALQPLLRLVSAMSGMTPASRKAQLPTVANNAALATALLLMSHIDRARANVYSMSEGGDALRVLAYGGRGEKPGEFTKGGPASDAALDRVKAGESLIVKDWSKDPPPGFSKTQSDWRSFVAVPIIGGDGYAYGMITVDSPTAGSFLDTELHTVTVVAEILSIAFTLAYPRTAR